jgi:tyrosyl-tRNA synthetase
LDTTKLRCDSGREALDHQLTQKQLAVYVGVDPTAPSLHVGHLLPLMVLYWMYLLGYPAVSLVRFPDRYTRAELTIAS